MASNITAQSNAPSLPNPGPTAADSADALPFLSFAPGPSLCQAPNLTAVGGNPGMAGPLPTMSTTPMQDFGQPMGRTVQGAPPIAYVDGSDND